jgi:hypothetical protein
MGLQVCSWSDGALISRFKKKGHKSGSAPEIFHPSPQDMRIPGAGDYTPKSSAGASKSSRSLCRVKGGLRIDLRHVLNALLLAQAILSDRTTAKVSRRLCPSVTRNRTAFLGLADYNNLIFPKGLSQLGIRFGSALQKREA